MIRPSPSKACDGVAGDKPKRARRGARPAARERAPVRARAQADPPAARIAVRFLPVESLTPNERNARLHSARQVRRIADSIAAFGFNVPVLIDAGGVVLAGHGRLLAAKRLGLKEVPTIRLDHLTDAQRRAFMIADNRLAERASWDDRRLAVELAGLKSLDLDFALSATGFELKDIELRIGAGRRAGQKEARAARRVAGRPGRRPGGRHLGARAASARLRACARRRGLSRDRRRDPRLAGALRRKRPPSSGRAGVRSARAGGRRRPEGANADGGAK